MVCSLSARLPIRWPDSVLVLFRAMDAISQSQEVFSVDCSLSDTVTSKVYLKASAYLIAIVVVPLVFPGIFWYTQFKQVCTPESRCQGRTDGRGAPAVHRGE